VSKTNVVLNSTDQAIVFVANDAVFAQALAFLESIRINSPGVPLVCIPYDTRFEKILLLQKRYGFDVYPMDLDPELARLSTCIYGRPSQRLIKLQAFLLPLREFFFLDVDIIVLRNLAPVFNHSSAEIPLIYMDQSAGGSYILREDPRLANSREINSGSYLSSSRFLSFEQILSSVRDNLDLYLSSAFLATDDQPFLNFAIDMLGLKARDFHEAGLVYSPVCWFLSNNMTQTDRFSFRDIYSKREIALIHYAGYAQLGLHNAPKLSELYIHYLRSGCAFTGLDSEEFLK
jgi:hypothetical protein